MRVFKAHWYPHVKKRNLYIDAFGIKRIRRRRSRGGGSISCMEVDEKKICKENKSHMLINSNFELNV